MPHLVPYHIFKEKLYFFFLDTFLSRAYEQHIQMKEVFLVFPEKVFFFFFFICSCCSFIRIPDVYTCIFFISSKNISCGYFILGLPWWSISIEYPQHIFMQKKKAKCLSTVFDLITAHTPISSQSSNFLVFRLMSVYFYLLLYTEYVVGTNLDCLNKLRQFKWVQTTHSSKKKFGNKIAFASFNTPLMESSANLALTLS